MCGTIYNYVIRMSRISFLLLSIVFVWLVQLCLSYLQMKRFNSRIVELRKQGSKTAVGMTGNIYKRRVYAVLVVNEAMSIIAAERLSGWTVFTHLKPVTALVGRSLADIGEMPQFGIRPKIWRAFHNSARYITDHSATHEQESSAATALSRGRKKAEVPTGWNVDGPSKAKNV